jgi:quinoprotein glucose dehydrogenase
MFPNNSGIPNLRPAWLLYQTWIAIVAFASCKGFAAGPDWPVYLGDSGRSHYSPVDQINKTNVDQLDIAWTYYAGDIRPGRSQIECNPIVVDGVLYGTSPRVRVFALDAATGKKLWTFDPFAQGGDTNEVGINRGVVYWAEGDDRRILISADHYLYALDATTGHPIPSFGQDGRIDIKDGLGRDVSNLWMVSTTPGTVYGNLLFLPTRVGKGSGPAAPGHVRAYDIRTGRIVWIFHTIPHPGEPGYETWPPDAWTHVGGANCWTGMAVDERRGILYVPTASPAFDCWGGDRIGKDLYGNCLLALDAKTGRVLWHYQFVHHDLWDRDLPSPPTLLTVTRDGRKIDAVAQTTKAGYVYVFNRVTGEPLFPIREVPVPPSDLDGEVAWPTQPLPVKPAPLTRQVFSYNEITDISPESHRSVLDRFVRLQPHTPFAPPSTRGTIIWPGFDGGCEWGGAAADPDGVLYVNESEMPWILELQPTRRNAKAPASERGQQLFTQLCAVCHGIDRQGNPGQNVPALLDIGKTLHRDDIIKLLSTGRGAMPGFGFLSQNERGAVADFLLGNKSAPDSDRAVEISGSDVLGGIPYAITQFSRWFDKQGYPAVKPPWGTLNAIDLNTGEYRWRVPLGEEPALTARGIRPTGTENYAGPLVTGGGLVFIGASRDEVFHAFDRDTGKLLWQVKLPAGGYATPATYVLNGRQYVVIACGGGKCGTKSGDAYVAFALPDGKLGKTSDH